MLIPAFKLEMKNPILPGLAVVGKYDGENPCLTCATNAGRVFIHSPHERDEFTNAEVQYLNINRKVTCMATGALDPTHAREALLIGAQTTLFGYDIRNNTDIFYKDVPDGVNAMKVGIINSHDAPLAVVGGNCSIQGFDKDGQEQFWTVTGDNVACLEFCDVEGDGRAELLVGSEDYEIRIFQGAEVVSEVTETAAVMGLAALKGTKYGYALGNGTIGVYDRNRRVWRVKSKHTVSAIAGFDLDGDGEPELISGWNQGRLEVRHSETGEVVFKDTLASPVSAIVTADYRKDGAEEVIVCGASGEVRAYLPADSEQAGNLMDSNLELDQLQQLTERKAAVESELRSMVENNAAASAGTSDAGLIPTNTTVTTRLEQSAAEGCVHLVVEASSPDARVRAVCVFADQIFDGESFAVHEAGNTRSVRVPLRLKKDVGVELRVRAIVGGRGGAAFHVFELSRQLPKFASYAPAAPGGPRPSSHVTFRIPDRAAALKSWVEESFCPEVLQAPGAPQRLDLVSLRGGQRLALEVEGGAVTVRVDDMDAAADVVQDLCAKLSISELEAEADFPREMAAFKEVLQRVEDYNAVRVQMAADMADSSNLVKQLVIRAEDARMLQDMKQMRAMYAQLHSLNQELVGEYVKRTTNHESLLQALKEVNGMIQKAAKLRAGSAKSRVITACRSAIKNNNIHALFRIIQSGFE